MPWSVGDVDKHNKGLSPNQKKQWVAVANDALKRCEAKGGKDCDAHAIRQANAAVAKSNIVEFSLTIRAAHFDEATQEMRWKADASDIDNDTYNDNMTFELFGDFIQRIESKERPPEVFCSEFWSGGMPYLSVSHYDDLNGDGVPGIPDVVYMDGKILKAKGKYFDTPLGRACFKSVCESLHTTPEKPVRISIAFYDYMHKHKSTGTIFERKSLDDSCKECLREAVDKFLDGKESDGKEYLRGHLIHLAHTRVPVNKRTNMEVDRSMTTQKEDATSIIGEELAKELDEKEKAMIGKSETLENTNSLVFKAEEDKCPKCGKKLVDGKCPECSKEEVEEGCGDKKKKKSDYDFAPLESKVDKMLSILTAPEEPKPAHVLDESFNQFKNDFDSVMLSDTTVEEKLRSLQDPINAVGNTVISVVKAESKPVTPEKVESDKLNQLTELVASLAQRMELISTQLSNPQVKRESVVTTPAVPQRRNISLPPELLAKKTESITPKLHDIIMKTV